MDTLERARRQSLEVQRRLDRQTGYLWLAGTMNDPRLVGKLLQVMRQDSEEISRESMKLQAILFEIRENREKKGESNIVQKLALTVLLVMMALLLIGGMPTRAQDATAEATVESTATLVSSEPIIAPEATEVPTPAQSPVIIVQEPTNTNSIYVVGFLALLAFSGLTAFLHSRDVSKLTDTVNIALSNKQVIDEGHRLYMESSLSVQNFITLFGSLAGFIGGAIPGDDLADKAKQFIDRVKDPSSSPTEPPQQPGVVG